jgi:hypothetical protein
MKGTPSRYYPGYGQVIAVHLGGIRYRLSANGNPESRALNPRAARRCLLPAKEPSSSLVVPSLPLPTCSFDDLELVHFDFGADLVETSEFADFFGTKRESLNPADDPDECFFGFMNGP